VYQRAVGEDKTGYLDELTNNPVWNIAELRPALYDEVNAVVSQALYEASISSDIDPPEDWEWQYPDLDISESDAERLAKEIFGALPWEASREDFAEHYNNFPAAAAEKEKHDPFYEKGMDTEEYLESGKPSPTDSDDSGG
jgi:hypothetical protein